MQNHYVNDTLFAGVILVWIWTQVSSVGKQHFPM